MTPLSDRTVVHLQEVINESPALQERYVIGELIGRGGMGVVYRAHDRMLSRDVALKVLETRAPTALSASERLHREAVILAQLEHPGIVPVHDVGTLADGRVFYVMRLVRGVRLDEHITPLVGRGELLRIMLRLCDTVAFANAQGVVHRDLKPGNIMIGPFGDVLVLDWGVAKLLAANTLHDASERQDVAAFSSATHDAFGRASHLEPLTGAGMVVGTPGYMSPEQEAGASAHVNQTADVFALGVILRELMPKGSATRDRALDAIIAHATAARADGRYPSAEALATDIRRWLDGQPVSAYRENAFERLGRAYRQHQVAVWLVAAYLTLRITVLLWRHI